MSILVPWDKTPVHAFEASSWPPSGRGCIKCPINKIAHDNIRSHRFKHATHGCQICGLAEWRHAE